MNLSERIGNLFFFSKKKRGKKEENDEESYKEKMICRFVLDGVGKKVGESIAIDDDILIIKTEKKYLGVPLKHVEEEGKTLLVKGLVDRGKAEEMGDKWLQETYYKTSKNIDKPSNEE